jgi:predicted nucleic acid-binding protein
MIFVDTNVVSETMRARPSGAIDAWVDRNGDKLFISTVVLAEIRFGIERVRPDERSPRWSIVLKRWREQLVDRVAAFDEDSADAYGLIMGDAHLRGRAVAPVDGMIAAIALRHGAALATRNARHFEGLGLRLHDPWAAE